MTKKIITFVRLVDRINMRVAKVSSFAVLLLLGVFMYGVIMRYVFNQAVHWEGDIGWLLFLGFSVLVGAYVLRQDYHVRLDVLYGRFSPKQKAIMDAVTFAFFLIFMVLITWFFINKAIWSVSVMERNPHSSFHGPIYPARIFLATASILLLFQGVAEFIGNIFHIAGHKIEGRVK